MHSEALRGHQRHLEAIRGHRRPSEALAWTSSSCLASRSAAIASLTSSRVLVEEDWPAVENAAEPLRGRIAGNDEEPPNMAPLRSLLWSSAYLWGDGAAVSTGMQGRSSVAISVLELA
jgi:hypothetical protein